MRDLKSNREYHRKYYSEHKEIIKGIRKTDDLNILCKACNWLYFLEQKYGIKYNIQVIDSGGSNI